MMNTVAQCQWLTGVETVHEWSVPTCGIKTVFSPKCVSRVQACIHFGAILSTLTKQSMKYVSSSLIQEIFRNKSTKF